MVHVTKMTTADGRLNHTLACELRWAQVYEIMTAVGRLQCKLQGLAKRGVYFAGAVCVRVRVCVYVCWKGEVVKDWWSNATTSSCLHCDHHTSHHIAAAAIDVLDCFLCASLTS